tara:strand:+ start:613 stop:1515 length:903 start_codon:yes stop_codon:yes gene_type:complete
VESFNLLLKSVDPKAPLSVEALLRELFIGIPIPIIKLAAGIMGAELTEDSIRRLIVREGKSSSIRRKITLKHPTVNLSNLLSSSDAVLQGFIESSFNNIPNAYVPLVCAAMYLPRYSTNIEYLFGYFACVDVYISRCDFNKEKKNSTYYRNIKVHPIVIAFIQDSDPLKRWSLWVKKILRLEGVKGSMARSMFYDLNAFKSSDLLDEDYSKSSRFFKKPGLGIKSIERMICLASSIKNQDWRRQAYVSLLFAYKATVIKRSEVWDIVMPTWCYQEKLFSNYIQDAEKAFTEYFAYLEKRR